MPLLEVTNLTKRFANVTAVDGLSFHARGGEIVGLLGPNGAGKSTTFLCAAGLLRPDGGSFVYDGRDLGSDRPNTIGLIPETPDVYPMLTVWEHLVFVAKSCRVPNGWQQRGEDLLQRLGMAEQRNTLGSALSKGMRQKTLIAAGILAGTPVLLLDEPMLGLDPLGQRELRQILRDLKARDVAVVISTHILEQAEAICDRAIIMKAGHAVASGTFAELRSLGDGVSGVEDVFLELTR